MASLPFDATALLILFARVGAVLMLLPVFSEEAVPSRIRLLAAPLIVYGIVFNVALGLASRLAPAIQIFFIAQPLNLLLGVTLFATILGALLTAFAAAMAAWLQNGWS